jgi:predicted RNA-binding protein with PUA-like domain
MSRWLVKTEPSTYSYANLERDGRTTWDGVSNPVALKNIAAMKVGDDVFIYHTGDEKAIVGLAKVAGEPRRDPKHEKLTVVDLEAVRPLAKPVTLAAVKQSGTFGDFALVRVGRLSVMPVTDAEWTALMKMAGA